MHICNHGGWKGKGVLLFVVENAVSICMSPEQISSRPRSSSILAVSVLGSVVDTQCSDIMPNVELRTVWLVWCGVVGQIHCRSPVYIN